DIEIVPFLEAIRQFRREVGRENVCYIHLTLVPYLGPSGEQKTKPTQHSVTELRSRGIQPDVIVCRSDRPLDESLKRKISLLCDVQIDAVISNVDAGSIYEIPVLLHEERLDDTVCQILALGDHPIDLSSWEAFLHRVESATELVRIGVVGKYVGYPDAYLSVVEALHHAGFHHGAHIELEWIQAESVDETSVGAILPTLDGIIIPGGFGERGIEGKIVAAHWARRNELPCLGICLGLQVMVVEFARSVVGLADANSSEFNTDRFETPYPVIDLMDEQHTVTDMGGTMRLGAYPAILRPGSRVAAAYGETTVIERHRHRYEVNNRFRQRLEDGGLSCSGLSPDERLVEFIELSEHPFWIGTQAHPEFKSRPDRPHPLFRELVGAAVVRSRQRNPHLFEIGPDAVA
ncbi:MAG TPA: CTP synthase, partial [Acidimicrobiales bacterium]|nr:CTP synthase [Acidimicrobiales bacterium]